MIIVGDGPSAQDFKAPDNVKIIAVNGVIDWINRADHFFTLDHSDVNIKRMKNQRPGVKYHAAVPNAVKLPKGVQRYHRIANESKPENRPWKLSPSWMFWRLGCVPGLSENPLAINTGNSAYGALGLAHHMGIKKVVLIGVDGTYEERISGGMPNCLSHLGMLFASALPQIDIVSCGGLNTVPQMTTRKALAWLKL